MVVSHPDESALDDLTRTSAARNREKLVLSWCGVAQLP